MACHIDEKRFFAVTDILIIFSTIARMQVARRLSQQDNGTCSNFGYRRCPSITIRLMGHILEDTLTETKKIINLLCPY